MVKNARLFGILLVAVGLGGYFMSSTKSMTALIPAYFGAGVLFCVLLGNMENMRRKATMLMTLVSLLGVGGAGSRLPKSYTAWQQAETAYSLAFFTQAAMAVLCLFLFLRCVRALIAREEAQRVEA